MDKRACVYVRVAWLVVAMLAVLVCRVYVAQLRFVHIGFCPPVVTGAPSLLVLDTFRVETRCVPLPPLPQVAPTLPPSDKKTGV